MMLENSQKLSLTSFVPHEKLISLKRLMFEERKPPVKFNPFIDGTITLAVFVLIGSILLRKK